MRRRRAFQHLTLTVSNLESTRVREQRHRDTIAECNRNITNGVVRSGRSLYDAQPLYFACIYYTMSVLCVYVCASLLVESYTCRHANRSNAMCRIPATRVAFRSRVSRWIAR